MKAIRIELMFDDRDEAWIEEGIDRLTHMDVPHGSLATMVFRGISLPEWTKSGMVQELFK